MCMSKFVINVFYIVLDLTVSSKNVAFRETGWIYFLKNMWNRNVLIVYLLMISLLKLK